MGERINNVIEEVKSKLDSYINKIKEEINSLLDKHSHKIDELKNEFEKYLRNKDYNAILNLIPEIRKIRRTIYTEVREFISGKKLEFRRLTWDIKRSLLNLPPEKREELQTEIDRLIDEYEDIFEDLTESLEDNLDYLTDLLDSLIDEAKDVARTYYYKGYITSVKPTIKTISTIIKDVEKNISDLTAKALTLAMERLEKASKELENVLKEDFKTVKEGPSMVVSSIRLPKQDLEIIDALVEAGIFKSRSEGVAFFTHKGIQASAGILKKLKNKIDEIRRIQQEIKEEIEKFMRGESK